MHEIFGKFTEGSVHCVTDLFRTHRNLATTANRKGLIIKVKFIEVLPIYLEIYQYFPSKIFWPKSLPMEALVLGR